MFGFKKTVYTQTISFIKNNVTAIEEMKTNLLFLFPIRNTGITFVY
jgi:hypothetical protein